MIGSPSAIRLPPGSPVPPAWTPPRRMRPHVRRIDRRNREQPLPYGEFLTVSLPAAGVYRYPFSDHRPSIAVAVAAAACDHDSPKAAAEAAAAVVSAETHAGAVAIIANRAPLAVHRDGHHLSPLSPEA